MFRDNPIDCVNCRIDSPRFILTRSFNSNGGSPVTSQPILVGTSAVQPPAPARRGYAFAGWISDFTLVNFNFSTPVNANLALYAAWTALGNVSYSGNGSTGGAVPAGTTAFAPGATVTVLGNTGNLVRSGFTFAGWDAAVNGSGAGYAVGDTFPMGTSNVTLYAQWTPAAATYAVAYTGNGNTGGTAPVDANSYAPGATVTTKANTGSLVKAGFSFAGWNAAANGGGAGYPAGATFAMGVAGITLYAQWSSGIVGGCSLDVDGNGQIDALTDGLVLMRAMFGLTGTAVTNGAIGGGTPTRSTWAVIQPYLNTNCGGNFAQ